MNSKTTNIIYFIGKYLFLLVMLYFIINFMKLDEIYNILITLVCNYFILKDGVVRQLENKDDYYVCKRCLDIPFIIITSIFLVVYLYFLKINYYIWIVIVIIHILTFKTLKVMHEELNEITTREIKEYFKRKKK